MIAEAFHELIAGNPQIQAEVGNRVFGNRAVQNVPRSEHYIVHQRISGVPTETLGGSSGLARSTWQVVVYGPNYRRCWQIAEKVRLALQGFQGMVDGFDVDWIHCTEQNDQPTTPFEGEQVGIFGARQDFAVWHAEAVPT